MTMNQLPVILFDGVCNLCSSWVQFLIRRDKKFVFRFASLQSESGKRILNSIGLSNNDLKTIVYFKEKTFFVESSAVLEILKDLGGIWKVSVIFQLIPKVVRDKIYRYIAKRRYKLFGIRSSCLLPTPENEKRFLP